MGSVFSLAAREPFVQSAGAWLHSAPGRVRSWGDSYAWGVARGIYEGAKGVLIALTVLLAAKLVIAGIALLSPVAAVVLTAVAVVAVAALLVYGAVNAYKQRKLEQLEAGLQPKFLPTAGVAVLDALGISGVWEGLIRRRIFTGEAIEPRAAGERLGSGAVYTLTLGLGASRMSIRNPQRVPNVTRGVPVSTTTPRSITGSTISQSAPKAMLLQTGPIQSRGVSNGTIISNTQTTPVVQAVRPHKFQFDVLNPGPLPKARADNFAGGKYSTFTLKRDMILYRAGSVDQPMGQWFSFRPPTSRAQTRIDSAIRPFWTDPHTGVLTGRSDLDMVYAIKIPRGTTAYVGPVGPQGGVYLGGSDKLQVFVEGQWKISGVKVVKSWRLK